MPSYFLRGLPLDLWERVRERAKIDNMPLRAIILKLLEAYASGEITITAERR